MGSFLSPSTILCLLLLSFVLAISEAHTLVGGRDHLLSYRRSLKISMEEEDEDIPILKSPPKKNLPTTTTTTKLDNNKNQTKLLELKKTKSTATSSSSTTTPKVPKPSNSTKLLKPSNSTKLLKPSNSSKLLKPSNSTKLLKPSNSTKLLKPIKPTKLNSTTTNNNKTKASTTTSSTDKPLKPKPADPSLPKNKTQPKSPPTSKPPLAKNPPQQKKPQKSLPKQVPHMPWLDDTDEDSDLISEFRDLPTKFQEALVPDLHRIHTTSKAYLTRANKEFTKTFKPLVGTKYAPTAAHAASGAFLILPLLLVALLLHHLRRAYHYLPLQKILLSVQIYLAIYFAILSLTAVSTGMEPLRFFYGTSPDSYVYTQVLQMLGYVLYLLLQLMNLVVVGGGGGGAGARAVAVSQVTVAMAVGLHYYTAVFHRAVLGEPPRTNWKVHGVYALCFAVVSVLAGAERRKKAYLHDDGGHDCKKS